MEENIKISRVFGAFYSVPKQEKFLKEVENASFKTCFNLFKKFVNSDLLKVLFHDMLLFFMKCWSFHIFFKLVERLCNALMVCRK